MIEIKNYIWIIPFVGGIITIISLFTPVVKWEVIDIKWYYWLIGFNYVEIKDYYNGKEIISKPTMNNNLVRISYICFIMILLGGILLLILAKKIRSNFYTKNFYKLGLSVAILLYVSPIIWIILADWPYIDIGEDTYYHGYKFWDLFQPSFGIIAPFISGSLCVVGLLAYNYRCKLKTDRIQPV